MRGGAQAHLLAASDGGFYVAKCRNNPQHRRVLINELICACLLQHLEITTPEAVLIEVTKDLIENSPELTLELVSSTIPVECGWQFGSRCPADPSTVAIYDFMPDSMLGMVNNLSHFLGVLAFDKWVSNSDPRQAIFCKRRGTASHPTKRYEAFMIDNGLAFNGQYWSHVNSPVQGLYTRKQVYDTVVSLDDFEPWLDRIVHFPEAIIDQAFRQIPAEWFEDDACTLQAFFETLMLRRKHVPGLIVDCTRANRNPFRKWSG
jgi:hypothetical protein